MAGQRTRSGRGCILAVLALAMMSVAACVADPAPVMGGAIAGNGQATVSWAPPPGDNASSLVAYVVTPFVGGVAQPSIRFNSTTTVQTVAGLTNGLTYTFVVRGIDSVGRDTAASRSSNAVTPGAVVALEGFGTIAGTCGVVAPQIQSASPSLFGGKNLDFGTDPYDDPVDRPELTSGAQEIILDGNAGGSAVLSEVFAFEVLARCEAATLLKTENEIVYTQPGKRTDLLVQLASSKVGVSVTRAVAFPAGTPYSPEHASTLLTDKLNGINESSQLVAPVDDWVKQILVVVAFDQQHADTIQAAWAGLAAATRADTIVYVVVTDGSDLNVYFSN